MLHYAIRHWQLVLNLIHGNKSMQFYAKEGNSSRDIGIFQLLSLIQFVRVVSESKQVTELVAIHAYGGLREAA